MNNLVINLATYGVTPGCVILSIGAVQFDPETGKEGAQFFRAIDVKKSLLMGFHQEEKTVDWWAGRSADAYLLAHSGTESPTTVLEKFTKWIQNTFEGQDIYVYGNSRLHLGILHQAYRQCGLVYPFNSYFERDYRTLFTLNDWTRNVRWATPYEGLKHDPVCDCRHEAKVISLIMQRLNLAA
jgi:exodeoxyribonuclease VIII